MKNTLPVAIAVAMVAVAGIAGVVVLSALHVDTTAVSTIIGLGLSALGGVIYSKVDATYNQSNGNLARLLDLVQRQSEQLAQMMPPPAPPAPPRPREAEDS